MTHRVLIIDDNETVLEVCKFVLQKVGITVVGTTLLAGEKASVSSLAEQIEHMSDPPHLILVDINMPGITGIEISQLFKKVWKISIPVYLFSDRSEDELKRLVEKSGADGYICKEWGSDTLVARVRDILGLGPAGRTPAGS